MNTQIVIIGGMGPQASLELHRRLIQQAAKFGAKEGKDFPEIIHLSLPVDDFISNARRTAHALETISVAMSNLYLWRQITHRYSLQYGSPAATGA